MKRIVIAALVAIPVVGISYWALACPCDRTPGLYLRGIEVREPVTDWSFANNPVCQNTLMVMEEHLQENRVPLNTTNLTVGRRLTVDPTNENFPNDADANPMLTRPYRKGFVVPERV